MVVRLVGVDLVGPTPPPPSGRQHRGHVVQQQPGTSGAHLAQAAGPDEIIEHAPDRCGRCGADLAGAVALLALRSYVATARK
jgi:hypothetical protein